MEEIIGSEDCAQILRCGVQQVEELARDGEIPGLKLGRSWIFVRSDLLDFLAEKARAQAEDRRAKKARQMQPTPTRQRRGRVPPPLPVPVPGMNYTAKQW